MGGDSLSITKGIVSRVVMTRYAHASNKLLGIQIDAAINPGNSGGPAFLDLQQALLSLASLLLPQPLQAAEDLNYAASASACILRVLSESKLKLGAAEKYAEVTLSCQWSSRGSRR